MAKKRGGHAGGHGWFVTFADLMGLLLSFFVMLVAFSSQDKQKLQIVAGSMRDAFGVQQVRFNGIIETDGLPTKPTLKNAARINPEVAHYTGQTELAEAIQEGLAAKAAGDEDTATTKLGRAVALAAQTGNEEATTRLRKVVDIDDEETGTVRLKRSIDKADEMALDTASTKTTRVRG